MPQDPSQPQVASGYYPADGGYSAPEQYASVPNQKVIPAGSIITLPYHNGKDGKPIQIRLEQDALEDDLQADLDAQFPKTAQNIGLEMLNGLTPVSQEDFDFVLKASEDMQKARDYRDKGDNGMMAKLSDVLPEAIKGLYEGALALGQSGVMAINTGYTPRQQINAVGSIIEGGIRGTEALADTGKMLFNLSTGDKYGAYVALKEMQAQEEIYKRGGGTLPLDPEAAAQANKIKNVLDVTVLMPGLGKLLGNIGKEAAVQTVKNIAEQSTVGLGRKVISGIADKVGSYGAEILATPAASTTGKIGAGILGTAAAYESDSPLLGAAVGLGLVKAPALAKAGMSTLKWAGKIAGADAASEVIAQGLKEAAEAGTKESTLRAVAKVLPSDHAMRAFGQIADSSINGALIGAGISGVQAAADPFNTGWDIAEQAAIGAAAGGAVGGLVGIVPAAIEYSPAGRNRAFVREMAKDIADRPENRSFVVGDTEVTVPDVQNRINLLNKEGMSTTDKARIFAILKSAEFSGNDVGFIDNSTVLPESLGGVGEAMGKGVRITPGYDGKRSTILINVDQINPASAVEEVTHAFVGREAGKKIISDLIVDRGGVSAALEPLIELGQRYYDLQVQSNPQAAAKFGRDLATAKDVNLPPQVRQQAAITLAEEWAANGIGEYLKNEDPTVLQLGRGNQNFIGDIIRKGLFEINSGLNLQPSAPTRDPITGFYYKDGKLINDPVLSGIAQKMKNAILYFDKGDGRYFPADQPGAPVKQRARKPSPAEEAGIQINDKLPDGTQVTGTRPEPRYEDTHAVDQASGAKAGSETKKSDKDKYHNNTFQQFAKITGEKVFDPEMSGLGVYFGQTTGIKPGTPIVYTRSLDNAQLEGLFNIQTHQGKPLIAPENRDAVARFNQAAKDGSLIVVDYDMNIGKETSGRSYAVSGQQVLLPLGIQQTQKGGPIGGVFNLSLLNDIINYQRLLPGMEKIDGALAQFGINTLGDVVPIVKTHIENYSAGGALPGVDALRAAFPQASKESATILRDLLHLSAGIQPRKAFSSEKRINEPFMGAIAELPKRQVTAYNVKGEARQAAMARERSVSNDIRLDGIRNVQLYADPNGMPVNVNVDLARFVPNQRSNFSPSTSISETLGDKRVVTDPETGRRAFIQPNGKTKVYGKDGSLTGIYEDFTEAQIKLNQADIRFSPRSPAAIARQAEQAKAMRARMEEEAPVRIMTEWLAAAGQAKQEAMPKRAEPQRAKGKIKPSIVEQAAVQAQSELLRKAESFAGFSQLTKNQRAQFLKDAAEAQNGIARQALDKIAAQQQQKLGGKAVARAARMGELSEKEMALFKADVERALAERDAPFLDVEETREILRKKPSKRKQIAPAELEAIARLEVAPEFIRRDLGPTPRPTAPGTYAGFEALSPVGLPREAAPAKQRISPRVVNLLGTDPTKSMAQILAELAKKSADRPKREPVKIEATAPIAEPPVEIVTPIDEPRLPSNMIVTRTPKGNFQLYVVTTAGKLSAEGLYNNYRDTLQRAQTKYQKKYATR